MKHVTAATIAKRFNMTEDEVLWSRKRGLMPGIAGYTIPDGKGRKLVFPADLKPPSENVFDDELPSSPEESPGEEEDETWTSPTR